MLPVILGGTHYILVVRRQNFWCDSVRSAHRPYYFEIGKIDQFRYLCLLTVWWRNESILLSLVAFKTIARVEFGMHLYFIFTRLLHLASFTCNKWIWRWLIIFCLWLDLVTSLFADRLVFVLLTLRQWVVVICDLIYFLISHKVYQRREIYLRTALRVDCQICNYICVWVFAL